MSAREHIAKVSSGCRAGDEGSAVLFALFACMVAALCVQLLTATVICARNALGEEVRGRGLLAATDACLADLKGKAAASWADTSWAALESGGATVSGRLVDEGESFGWTLTAEVKEMPLAPLGITSATVERGRDGLDIPHAAIVTSRLQSTVSRTAEWLLKGDATAEAILTDAKACLGGVDGATVVGGGCRVETLQREWRLDEGWRAVVNTVMSIGPRVYVTAGAPDELVRLPKATDLSAPESPALIVVTGGSELDMRGLAEVWGVVVVDEGSLYLDGTVLHGAAYATECVDVGESGRVVYEESVWQWARDASLVRVRLVPGSRQEGTE